MTGMRWDATAMEDGDGRARLSTVGRRIAGAVPWMERMGGRDRTGEPGLAARGHGVGRDARAASAGGAGQPTGNATNSACDSRMLAV